MRYASLKKVGIFRRLIGISVSILILVQCAPTPDRPAIGGTSAEVVPLPVKYASDRFYVVAVTVVGDTLLFYTDTGGGANMIYEGAVDRLGVETERLDIGNDSVEVVSMPPLSKESAIPSPSALPPFGDRLLVRKAPEHSASSDGFLGRTWFAGRVWEFDYPQQSLGLVTSLGHLTAPRSRRVALGFQTDSTGNRTTYFPRIRVHVEGDSFDLLFDTGATVHLTEGALDQLDDEGPSVRGTSFIVESVFERWRQHHPDWQVIEHADGMLDMPMIKVPEILIGGYTVGPVWFTMRPDRNFHDYMSQWMDRRVDGALGGSALRYFRVIVDYPNAVAIFDRS